MRNPRSRTHRAVLELQTNKKWVLTGTPIQNTSLDVVALLRFLGERDIVENWPSMRKVCEKIDHGDRFEQRRLQEKLRVLLLRRTKRKAPICLVCCFFIPLKDARSTASRFSNGRSLPSRPTAFRLSRTSACSTTRWPADTPTSLRDSICQVLFLFGVCCCFFGRPCCSGRLAEKHASVFTLLLRLRQLCLHPLLFVFGRLKHYKDSNNQYLLKSRQKLDVQEVENRNVVPFILF